VAEPPKLEHNMANLRELDKDLALNVPSVTSDGIDISLLTSVIRPIADLIETDMNWDYHNL
jgi:Intraflagellar transport protein 43